MTLQRESAALDVVHAPSLNAAWLVHGFSTRAQGKSTTYRPGIGSGDLNLGFTASDSEENVAANRDLFLNALTRKDERLGLVTVRQIHSAVSLRVGAGEIRARARLECDGLMTNTPGVLLGIQTADCIPVLVADGKQRAVAAFHAGWRGTVACIVELGIRQMHAEFGSNPEDLVAAVGPGIGQCCYSVGEEVREQFSARFPYASELFTANSDGQSPRISLDLAQANRRQLLAAGLKDSSVYMVAQCTGCHTDRFFSHRVEKGFTGRMMSVIGIRPLGSRSAD